MRRSSYVAGCLLAVGSLTAGSLGLAGTASADTVVWIHGATVLQIPLAETMKRVPPGYALHPVDYPAGLFPWTGLHSATGAQSITAGVPAIDAAMRAAQVDGQVLVLGESLGAMVVDQELRELAGRPDAPDPDTVRFEVIGDPTLPGGAFTYRPFGTYVPVTGTVYQPAAETPYDLTVIKLQYDGVASWPDRPWNLLAVANATLGALFYHGSDQYGTAAEQVLNGRLAPQSVVTNASGGVTTTYSMQQTPALLYPFERFMPNVVAAVSKKITPLINRGYSELTPDAGPHLAPGGELVDQSGQPVGPRAVRAAAAARQTASSPAHRRGHAAASRHN